MADESYYSAPTHYLASGDIFVRLPIPLLGPDEESFVEYGPAILVDEDCIICKPARSMALTFAPIFEAENALPDRSQIRTLEADARKIRRWMLLPAHASFSDFHQVADLNQLFTIPRAILALELVDLTDDGSEKRWRFTDHAGKNERVVTLSTDGNALLREKLGLYFGLDRTA